MGADILIYMAATVLFLAYDARKDKLRLKQKALERSEDTTGSEEPDLIPLDEEEASE